MDKIKKFILGNREPAYSHKLNTQLLYVARFLVGAYIIKIAFDLKDSIFNPESGGDAYVFGACALLFLIIGIGLVYASLRDFIIGRYKGGKLDLGDEESKED